MMGLEPIVRTFEDYKLAFLEHIGHILAFQSERKALLDIRRVGCWYLRLGRGTKALREGINRSRELREALELIHNFSWDTADYSECLQEALSCGSESC
jgi:tRNA-dihydrouridine synthase B